MPLVVQGPGMGLDVLGDLGLHGLLEHPTGTFPEGLVQRGQQSTRGFRIGLVCGSFNHVACPSPSLGVCGVVS